MTDYYLTNLHGEPHDYERNNEGGVIDPEYWDDVDLDDILDFELDDELDDIMTEIQEEIYKNRG